ncbi:SDR family oxidoreductase [Haemophilus paraphrohaemolyticus]|uniref:SDR family oxidoreductase n=1 Tax=Haemophilus paraphrohaemolyticus TaxID=736 RepID=A0A369ZU95_9PAST|nr:SDR family oxidoreductase [Haemophilus paraphrohaemolyticus]RDF11318.1 SDR family oxidoreductase [Haemophilus paraphrohaemolyticus]
MKIAITGTSGNIGGMVARHLNSRSLPLILPLRNPAKAPDLTNCEARRFAYGDLELAKQALNGVDVLFMVSAAESLTREQEHLTLVQAASEAGVKHMVYLSFAQAALDSIFTLARTHAVTENVIRQTNMCYTFLRDNFYSEMMATIANADGIIAGPAEDGRVACVSQRDVAQAAANVIADIECGNHRHDNQTYTLTGSQSLSCAEIAAVLTEITGKPHRYHNETVEEAFAIRKAEYSDMPDWQIEAWVSTYTAIAKGELAAVSDDLPQLLGRTPLNFEDVVKAQYAK